MTQFRTDVRRSNKQATLKARTRLRDCFVVSLLTPTFVIIVEAAVLISWEHEGVRTFLQESLFMGIWTVAGVALSPSDGALLTRPFRQQQPAPA